MDRRGGIEVKRGAVPAERQKPCSVRRRKTSHPSTGKNGRAKRKNTSCLEKQGEGKARGRRLKGITSSRRSKKGTKNWEKKGGGHHREGKKGKIGWPKGFGTGGGGTSRKGGQKLALKYQKSVKGYERDMKQEDKEGERLYQEKTSEEKRLRRRAAKPIEIA